LTVLNVIEDNRIGRLSILAFFTVTTNQKPRRFETLRIVGDGYENMEIVPFGVPSM